MGSSKEDKEYNWILQSRKVPLKRRIANQDNSDRHSPRRSFLTAELKEAFGETVPLPSMFIGLPRKSSPNHKFKAKQDTFLKKQSHAGRFEDNNRIRLVDDIFTKMEYVPKESISKQVNGSKVETFQNKNTGWKNTEKLDNIFGSFIENSDVTEESHHNLEQEKSRVDSLSTDFENKQVDLKINNRVSTPLVPKSTHWNMKHSHNAESKHSLKNLFDNSPIKSIADEDSHLMLTPSPASINLSGISRCARKISKKNSRFDGLNEVERLMREDGPSNDNMLISCKVVDNVNIKGQYYVNDEISKVIPNVNSRMEKSRSYQLHGDTDEMNILSSEEWACYTGKPKSVLYSNINRNNGIMLREKLGTSTQTIQSILKRNDCTSHVLSPFDGQKNRDREWRITNDFLNKSLSNRPTTKHLSVSSNHDRSDSHDHHIIDKSCFYANGIHEEHSKMKNEDNSNEHQISRLKNASIDRPIPLPLRRNLSIGLYAIQVADIQGKEDESEKYRHQLIMARTFRKWCIMFRLRKMLRKEEQRATNRACQHWKYKQLTKCFNAMKSHHKKTTQLADEYYERNLLRKVLSAILETVVRRRKLLDDHLAKKKGKIMATAWLQWTNKVSNKRREKMKALFTRWKERHLQMKRVILMEKVTERQVVKNRYYKWKKAYTADQQDSISNLHHKIVLLSKCWQYWRVYTAERRVKNRMNDVARIHFEGISTRKALQRWRAAVGKSSLLTRQLNKRLLTRVFYSWRNWTAYSKVLGKRHLSACKEYHNKSLLRLSINRWRNQLNLKIAVKHWSKVQQRKMLTLWQLRLKRKVLHRKLCKAQGRKARQTRCFVAWLEYTRVFIQKREQFVKIIMRLELRIYLNRWRDYAGKSNQLDQSNIALLELRERKLLRDAFDLWKHSLKIVFFKRQCDESRLQRIVRRAATKWRTKVKKRYLRQKLLSWHPVLERLRLKGALRQWIQSKRAAERERQEALIVASILNRGCMSRVLSAWRIVTQEDRIICHMVIRMQRRAVARVFDAWRLVVTRKKVSMQYRRVKEKEKMRILFFKWRNKFNVIKNKILREEEMKKSILNRCVIVWKDHVIAMKSRKLQSAKKYFSHWQELVTRRTLIRERRKGAEARRCILLKLKFRMWREHTVIVRKQRITNRIIADKFRREKYCRKMIAIWKRRFQTHCIVLEHLEYKRILTLKNAFNGWKDFIKQQLQDAMGRFTDRLESSPRSIRQHALSESFGSGGFPPLRASSGYFGSLPNMTRIHSPLPVSPLASSPEKGGDSPLSMSPEHGMLTNHQRSKTLDSPRLPGNQGLSSLPRCQSYSEGPKAPFSLRSTGSFSAKDRRPLTVPPLFTDPSQFEDEDYTDLIRPVSNSLERNGISHRSDAFLQRDRSMDDDSAPVHFSHSDEDAMSYYSFQSESVGINREMFISGTIRHWRQLPLSITFKAWLKFTQQQKIRRELLDHIISNKRFFLLRRGFLVWHRKLYCRLVVEKFSRARLLRKYFKAMFEHLSRRKAKDERHLIAELHLKNTKLELTFKTWQKRFYAKRRLQSLIGKWHRAIHISERQKEICERLVRTRESKALSEAFMAWKEASYKVNMALELSETLLTKRAFRKWHKTARVLKSLRTKRDVATMNNISKVFKKWKICIEQKRRAEKHFESVQKQRHKSIFAAWLFWSQRKRKLSGMMVNFQKNLNMKIIAKAFFIWSEETARYNMADDHHKESLLIRILESWHGLTEKKIDLRIRHEDFQRYEIRLKMRNVFDWWKRSAICSKVFQERRVFQEQQLLANVLRKWSRDVRQIKWRRHLRFNIQKKSLKFWFQKTLHLGKRRVLVEKSARKWISVTRACIRQNAIAEDWHTNKDRLILRNFFMQWVEAANGQKIARIHYDYQLVTRIVQRWHEMTIKAKELRQNQNSTKMIVEYNSMSKAFFSWHALFQRCKKNSVILENYLELKQQEHLKLCLNNFRLNAMKCRSQKYDRIRMQRTAFHRWKLFTERSKMLAEVKTKLVRISVLRMADLWKRKTKDLLAQEKLADNKLKKKNMKLTKETFQIWLLKTRGRLLARMCFQGHLMKNSFQNWHKATEKKINLRNKLKEFQGRKNNKQLALKFMYWKRCSKESSKRRKIEEIHDQIAESHYRSRLLENYFRCWYQEALISKRLKLQQEKFVRKCFIAWKNFAVGCNRAEEMYDQNLLERGWRNWRTLRVKRQVMRAMQDHEDKQILSEVFSAWYNYTYISQQAIREFHLFKKRKIFRKWMQEYNKS